MRQLDPAMISRVVEMNVLVVDDSAFDRELAQSILRKIGFGGIQSAENGAVAAAKITTGLKVKKPFDIILLDARMPTEDGHHFLNWLRQDPKLKSLIVIVTSGNSDLATVKKFQSQGIQGLVVKPLTIEALTEKVAEALARVTQDAA